ncbi:cell division protein SepF [Pseudonocardia humida]|uniref:cell division protein SepF n=1 Tax=Pseudonocardia humida TaxID=2800819 RepID=UPI00207C506E|nr:cell division protein SepF [Pseudonocardia humida]
MGTMYRLKAYFGMVPAEELTEYVDEPLDRYPAPRRSRDDEDRWAERRRPDQHRSDPRRDDPRWEDKRWAEPGWDERRRDSATWDDGHWDDDRYPDDDHGSEPTRSDDPRRGDLPRDERGPRRPSRPSVVPDRRRPVSAASSPVRGALAIDTDTVAVPEPVRAVVPVAAVPGPVGAAEARDRVATLARITTLSPRSYKEARTIGERYRDGQPVIMNLTELDAADAKRLVDFAAGLAFALRGGFDKIATRVFLLTPADVEVSADDARKLAERGLFRQD